MNSYILADNFTLEREESGNYPALELNIATGILTGSLFQGKTDDGHAMMSAPDGTSWIIPHTLTDECIEELAAQYDCACYFPMRNELFSRNLMLKYPMIINPITAMNGVLVGQWRVESNGISNGIAVTSALAHTLPEFIATQSADMQEAIIQNGLLQAGIGRYAYMYFQDDMDTYDLVYISSETARAVAKDSMFWAYCVRVESLDKYAVVGAPEHEESLAAEQAKLKLVAQVAEYKRESAPLPDADEVI